MLKLWLKDNPHATEQKKRANREVQLPDIALTLSVERSVPLYPNSPMPDNLHNEIPKHRPPSSDLSHPDRQEAEPVHNLSQARRHRRQRSESIMIINYFL